MPGANEASPDTRGAKMEAQDNRTLWQKFDDWLWFGKQDVFEDQVYMSPLLPTFEALD